MSYTPQNFAPGQILTAEAMNAVETGIYDNAEDIDVLKSVTADSGWITIAPGPNFLDYTDGEDPIYRKIGSVVTVSGVLKPASSSVAINTGGSIVMFSLPIGFRPKFTVFVVCHGSGANRWLLTIFPNGNVCASRYGTDAYASSVSGNEWMAFHAAFIAA